MNIGQPKKVWEVREAPVPPKTKPKKQPKAVPAEKETVPA